MRIAVLGASGFIGRGLVAHLRDRGLAVRAISRAPLAPIEDVEAVQVEDYDRRHLEAHLAGMDGCVILAGRAHILRDRSSNPTADFRRANVESAISIAEAAGAAGVRRIVFLSTIGVHGAETGAQPFRFDDPPRPHSIYAETKLEAEIELGELCRSRNIELAVIRPPLVYGPGAPGNFGLLVKLARLPVPLPFGAIQNARSMISRENLADLIHTCLSHPNAPGGTFLAGDGEDFSTTQILRELRKACGMSPMLVPVPQGLLRKLLALTGKAGLAQRLLGSLRVDIGPTTRSLDWIPPVDALRALRESVAADPMRGHA